MDGKDINDLMPLQRSGHDAVPDQAHGHSLQIRASVEESVQRFERLFSKELEIPRDDPLSPFYKSYIQPYCLDDILGKDSQHRYWWRLYISPTHHHAALKRSPTNPGSFYDTNPFAKDGSTKGYQSAMVAAYKKWLNDDLSDTTLNFEIYQSMYAAVARDVKSGKYGHGIRERERTDGNTKIRGNIRRAQYPIGANIANDLLPSEPDTILEPSQWYEMYVYGRRLAVSTAAEQQTEPFWAIWSQPYSGSFYPVPFMDVISCVDWSKPMEEVLGGFQNDMVSAGTRIAQLEAIARLIRRVHMLHIFVEGNKRLHIYLLLNHLLLRFGFGLPLGGKYAKELNKLEALEEVFQGAYTVQQIAQFLWLAQDFGLLSKDPKNTIILGLEDSMFGHKFKEKFEITEDSKDKVAINIGLAIKDNSTTNKSAEVEQERDAAPPARAKTPNPPIIRKSSSYDKLSSSIYAAVNNSDTNIKTVADLNEGPSEIPINQQVSVIHNDRAAIISKNPGQTTVIHNGTFTAIKHRAARTKIDTIGKNQVTAIVTHPDGSHTHISHSNGVTTINHHENKRPNPSIRSRSQQRSALALTESTAKQRTSLIREESKTRYRQ